MDNKSAIDLAYNPEHHQRSKHIDRRHCFIREKVETFDITVPFVRGADNLADFFTKPLPPRLFFPMLDLIMNACRLSGLRPPVTVPSNNTKGSKWVETANMCAYLCTVFLFKEHERQGPVRRRRQRAISYRGYARRSADECDECPSIAGTKTRMSNDLG
eukprot:733722-Pleurochrysis_carterae.AAC.1